MQIKKIGNHLKTLREDAGLSVRDLSDKTGIAYGYIDDIENGKANPTESILEELAHVLGTDLKGILEAHEKHAEG